MRTQLVVTVRYINQTHFISPRVPGRVSRGSVLQGRVGAVPRCEFPVDAERSSTSLVLRAKDPRSIPSTAGSLRCYLDPRSSGMLSQGLNASLCSLFFVLQKVLI